MPDKWEKYWSGKTSPEHPYTESSYGDLADETRPSEQDMAGQFRIRWRLARRGNERAGPAMDVAPVNGADDGLLGGCLGHRRQVYDRPVPQNPPTTRFPPARTHREPR